MISHFDERVRLTGSLYVNDDEVGECEYTLSYNPYESNSMHVELLNPPSEMIQLEPESMRLVSSFGGDDVDEVIMEAGFHRFETTSFATTVASAPVTRYRSERWYGDSSEATRISVGYRFPLTSISDRRVITYKDAATGLLRGVDRVQAGEYTRKERAFLIEDGSDRIAISDAFDFPTAESPDLYDVHALVRRSQATFKRNLNEATWDDVLEDVRQKSKMLFEVISLVERDRINYTVEEIALHRDGTGRTAVGVIRTMKWASPPSTTYSRRRNTWQQGQARKESTVRVVLHTYQSQDAQRAGIVERTLRNFQVANCASTIESGFVYWHSCIDFFLKLHLGRDNRSFSLRLIEVCDNNSIHIEDLVDAASIAAFRRGEKKVPPIRFTDLRNAYIHDGFDAFKDCYDEVFVLTNKMRALAERLLFNYLGIDYRETSLGHP